MDEWKLISEEYPPYDIPVLVTDGESLQIRILKKYHNGRMWKTDHEKNMNYSVSHWMHLPKLPE